MDVGSSEEPGGPIRAENKKWEGVLVHVQQKGCKRIWKVSPSKAGSTAGVRGRQAEEGRRAGGRDPTSSGALSHIKTSRSDKQRGECSAPRYHLLSEHSY